MPSTSLEELGLTRTEGNKDFEDSLDQIIALWIILDRAWRSPFTIKSNFARDSAMHVAICASEGFISTALDEDCWGNRWGITEDGRDFKEDLDERIRQLIS
jgi:hypothetical protein